METNTEPPRNRSGTAAGCVLYTTETCPRCRELKRSLLSAGIAFEEKDAASDSEALAEMLMHGHDSVPVLAVREENPRTESASARVPGLRGRRAVGSRGADGERERKKERGRERKEKGKRKKEV